VEAGVDAGAMARQVEAVFARPAGQTSSPDPSPLAVQPGVVDFVCEEDVRQAVRLARKIVIGERTIVTPAARDMGDAHRIFVIAGWPRG
jgi:hypothetical protein